jgi:hypothetical protein
MSAQPQDPSLWFFQESITGPAVVTCLTHGTWILATEDGENAAQFDGRNVNLAALYVHHDFILRPEVKGKGFVSGYRVL